MAKFNRIRENIKDYVDMDYIKKLSPEDQEFMSKFVDEYYCGGHNKPNSMIREAYGEAYDIKVDGVKNIKQQLNGDMNAQNRDVTGIAGCSFNMLDIDPFIDELSTPEDDSIDKLLVTHEPNDLINDMIKDLVDELNILSKEELSDRFRSFAYDAIHIYILHSKEQRRQKKRINK